MLPLILRMSQEHVKRIVQAVADLVNDTFPARSHDLQSGSTQDAEYRRVLILIMSGAVKAAEDKQDVTPLLEVSATSL